MARRSIDIKIEEKGRDQGKLFKITEMSAFDTEVWAEQTINAILRNAKSEDLSLILPVVYSYVNGVNLERTLDETIKDQEDGKVALNQSSETLAIYFASSFFRLPYEELQIVTAPLLGCCSIYLDPSKMDLSEPVLNNPNQYIEEPSTIFSLKREAFKLHTDFFTQSVKSRLTVLLNQAQAE